METALLTVDSNYSRMYNYEIVFIVLVGKKSKQFHKYCKETTEMMK